MGKCIDQCQRAEHLHIRQVCKILIFHALFKKKSKHTFLHKTLKFPIFFITVFINFNSRQWFQRSSTMSYPKYDFDSSKKRLFTNDVAGEKQVSSSVPTFVLRFIHY